MIKNNSIGTTSNRGVGYYNKEEQRRIKKNILGNEETSFLTKENNFSFLSSGISADASTEDSGVGHSAPQESMLVVSEPESVLNLDMIERAPIQLWDNGETAVQRYKLKVRLNLHNDRSNPEFIASLTKDPRNFKKFIPAECKDQIIEKAQKIRADIKHRLGTYPYIGKFHLNNGFTPGSRVSNQIEPWSMVAVWYDNVEGGWSGVLFLHDWVHQFDLFDNNATAKQKAAGLKCSTLFINPKYDCRQRPKTWEEKRKGL